MFAGREATPAEIDELATELLDKVDRGRDRRRRTARDQHALGGGFAPGSDRGLRRRPARRRARARRAARQADRGRPSAGRANASKAGASSSTRPEAHSSASHGPGRTVGLMCFASLPLTAAALLLAGCGGGSNSSGSSELPVGSEQVKLDPADFTTRDRQPVLADGSREPLGLPRGGRTRRSPARRGHCHEPDEDDRRDRGAGRPRPRDHRTVRRSRTPSTGTRRTRTATSGTWARTRRSTRTARSRRPRAPGSTASTAPRRESSFPQSRSKGSPTARSTTPGTPRTPPKCSASTARCRCRTGCSGTR